MAALFGAAKMLHLMCAVWAKNKPGGYRAGLRVSDGFFSSIQVVSMHHAGWLYLLGDLKTFIQVLECFNALGRADFIRKRIRTHHLFLRGSMPSSGLIASAILHQKYPSNLPSLSACTHYIAKFTPCQLLFTNFSRFFSPPCIPRRCKSPHFSSSSTASCMPHTTQNQGHSSGPWSWRYAFRNSKCTRQIFAARRAPITCQACRNTACLPPRHTVPK